MARSVKFSNSANIFLNDRIADQWFEDLEHGFLYEHPIARRNVQQLAGGWRKICCPVVLDQIDDRELAGASRQSEAMYRRQAVENYPAGATCAPWMPWRAIESATKPDQHEWAKRLERLSNVQAPEPNEHGPRFSIKVETRLGPPIAGCADAPFVIHPRSTTAHLGALREHVRFSHIEPGQNLSSCLTSLLSP